MRRHELVRVRAHIDETRVDLYIGPSIVSPHQLHRPSRNVYVADLALTHVIHPVALESEIHTPRARQRRRDPHPQHIGRVGDHLHHANQTKRNRTRISSAAIRTLCESRILTSPILAGPRTQVTDLNPPRSPRLRAGSDVWPSGQRGDDLSGVLPTPLAAVSKRSLDCVEACLCEPRSPRQRPSNEQTNGLRRRRLPEGTNFDIGTIRPTLIAVNLNTIPRKHHN